MVTPPTTPLTRFPSPSYTNVAAAAALHSRHAVLAVIGVTGGASGDLLRHVTVGVVAENRAHYCLRLLGGDIGTLTGMCKMVIIVALHKLWF